MSRLKFLLFSNNNVPCEKALVTSAAGPAFLYRFESSWGEVPDPLQTSFRDPVLGLFKGRDPGI